MRSDKGLYPFGQVGVIVVGIELNSAGTANLPVFRDKQRTNALDSSGRGTPKKAKRRGLA